MSKDYKKDFVKEIYRTIRRHPLLEITKRKSDDSPRSYLKKVKDQLPQQIQDFYACCNGIKLEWTTKADAPVQAMGSINLLPIQNLIERNTMDLEEEVKEIEGWLFNTNHKEVFPNLKGAFHSFDLFMSDATIGFFSEEPNTKELYKHTFGISFESLKVDFEGYFQLLCKSYGFLWWQNVIIHREYGQEDGYAKYEHDEFKTKMPQLFPDFDFDEFIALYESLKIVD